MVHMSEVRKSNLTKVILAIGMERWGGCGNSLGVQGPARQEPKDAVKTCALV